MTFARAAGVLVVTLALAIGLWPGLVGLDPTLAPAAALVVLALGLWATAALPLPQTALLLFLLAVVLDIAPPAVIFAGFASSALWLVFGGLVIGNAVQSTGLGRRLARLVVGRLGGSYRSVIHGTVILSVALAFLISNPHSAACIEAAPSPRFSALALLGRLPSQRTNTRLAIRASQKPAHERKSTPTDRQDRS